MNSPSGQSVTLTTYRAQYQLLEEELANVQDDLAYMLQKPWHVRLLRRDRIRALKARHKDLQQKSESIHRLMRRLIKAHNPNAFK